MTFREFDNKCAEIADTCAEIGEKTVWFIIIVAVAATMYIMHPANAQSIIFPQQSTGSIYRPEIKTDFLTGQKYHTWVEDRGVWGTGYSIVTTTETRRNTDTNRNTEISTSRIVENDATGQPLEYDTEWILELLR